MKGKGLEWRCRFACGWMAVHWEKCARGDRQTGDRQTGWQGQRRRRDRESGRRLQVASYDYWEPVQWDEVVNQEVCSRSLLSLSSLSLSLPLPPALSLFRRWGGACTSSPPSPSTASPLYSDIASPTTVPAAPGPGSGSAALVPCKDEGRGFGMLLRVVDPSR